MFRFGYGATNRFGYGATKRNRNLAKRVRKPFDKEKSPYPVSAIKRFTALAGVQSVSSDACRGDDSAQFLINEHFLGPFVHKCWNILQNQNRKVITLETVQHAFELMDRKVYGGGVMQRCKNLVRLMKQNRRERRRRSREDDEDDEGDDINDTNSDTSGFGTKKGKRKRTKKEIEKSRRKRIRKEIERHANKRQNEIANNTYECLHFPVKTFKRIVKDKTLEQTNDSTIKWSSDSLGVVQIMIETEFIRLFIVSNLLSNHAKRSRVKLNDVTLASKIMYELHKIAI